MIMKRDTAGPGSKSLTYCEVNTSSVPSGMIMRSDTADLAVNPSPTVKSIQPECQVEGS